MKYVATKKAPAQSGFTLIELLAVIAVISILSAILIPTISSVRKKSAAAKAVSNARQIGMANTLYSQENNGEILGQGEWQDTMRMFRGFTQYLSNEPTPNEEQVIATLSGVVDPSVPTDFVKYGGYPYTWSINYIFNARYGRQSQDPSLRPPPGSGVPGVRPRRMVEFDDPANTIYAVSGGYEILVRNTDDAALLGEPQGRQPIFYFYGNNDQTPAVFLDGHTEMLAFPIDPRKLNPSLPR